LKKVVIPNLQLQLLESLDILNRKDLNEDTLGNEVESIHKLLQTCLLVQDRLMIE
jgi:hypothetical protein